jgi:hypothetical protein
MISRVAQTEAGRSWPAHICTLTLLPAANDNEYMKSINCTPGNLVGNIKDQGLVMYA